MTLFLPCCFECSFLAATAQISKPETKQLSLDIHFADVSNAHVILARHWRVQGAFRKVLLVGQAMTTLVMMTLSSLKTVRETGGPTFPALVFSAKKLDVQVLVSVFGFLTYSNADPGTSIFCKKRENLSITTIPTIKNIKFATLRVSEPE